MRRAEPCERSDLLAVALLNTLRTSTKIPAYTKGGQTHQGVRIIGVITLFIVASTFSSRGFAEETWFLVVSQDKKVSVLFPEEPTEIEELSRRSPAGAIHTRRAQYESEGALLTIAGTKLPNMALRFAGADKILHNAAEGVLSNFLGKRTSEKKTKIGGEPAVVLKYLVPDYEKKDHPGYRGIAIALLVDKTLYVINGILTKEDPKSKAHQKKLLGSIQVHK